MWNKTIEQTLEKTNSNANGISEKKAEQRLLLNGKNEIPKGKKKGISYTSETIRELFDKLEDNGKVNFVIGDDLIEGLPRWHDYEYLKSHVRFYCFTRDGGEKKNLEGVEVIYIDSPQTIASSTMFRDGEEGLVTPSVMEYIESEGLYQNKR